MFPFDIEDEDTVVEEESIPTDYEIDFKTGKLTGRMISGLDAIKQWVLIVLGTDRYFYTQYSWDHGSDLNSLIGQSPDKEYIESEAKRMVEDALSVNDDILGIDDFACEIEDDKLTVRFTLNTIYGGAEINV